MCTCLHVCLSACVSVCVSVAVHPLCVPPTEKDPLALHPLFALDWFRRLLIACEDAYHAQREGSLCSVMPSDGPLTDGGAPVGGLAAELVRYRETTMSGSCVVVAWLIG